jgi:hypothetical protein
MLAKQLNVECVYHQSNAPVKFNMVEEVKVVLRRSETCGLGFSLLGTAGLPPIIYDIIENSPAAESGEVRF